MTLRTLQPPAPIEAVIFDLHSTLVDQGDSEVWLELAWRRAGRPGSAREMLGPECFEKLARWLDRIWEHVVEVDPNGERDLSRARHRQVFDALVARNDAIDPRLAPALYDSMLETWVPYEDSRPTLLELRRRGIRIVLVSNIGVDVRPVLERARIAELLDGIVLSYEVGALKPHAAIFQHALRLLNVEPGRALMVGDSAQDDSGAARIGIRTLLLPRTRGPVHGLDAVVRLVGG